MQVKDRLRQVRRTLGLTQNKLAERLGISTSYLTGMERGDKRITDRSVRQISIEFGVSENWLKTGIGEMFDKTEDIDIAKALSLFKSLNPHFRSFALMHLDMLVELQNNDKNNAQE